MARKSLVGQMEDKFKEIEAFGRQRHGDKRNRDTQDKVYSFGTAKNYNANAARALRWIKKFAFETYGENVKWLGQAEKHVPAYIEYLKVNPSTSSASTIHSYTSALSKLFGRSNGDWGVILPPKNRKDITRSRNENTVRSKHFSKQKNADLVEFVRCTGLRNKKELQQISEKNLSADEKYLVNVLGKGGKLRTVPILGTPDEIAKVVNRIKFMGDNKTWPVVHSAFDGHHQRALYACDYYRMIARPEAELQGHDRYVCRKDYAGLVFDRKALIEVSHALGHGDERGSTIVASYLYPLANEMLGI